MVKSARPLVPEPTSAAKQLTDEERAMVLRRIAQWGLGGLGVGAGLAGIGQLGSWLFRPKVPEHELDLSPQEAEVVYPARQEEKPKRRLRKSASGDDWSDRLSALFGRGADAAGSLASSVADAATPTAPKADLSSWDFLKHWWALPLGTAATVGGLYGGNSLINWLGNKRRKSEEAGEVEDAKKEYEQAVLSMYNKDASAGPSSPFDPLYASLEKKGFFDLPPVSEMGSAGAGMYLTLAAMLAGLSGVGMYNYTKSRDPHKRLEKALKQRAQLRAMQNPPELHLRPRAVPGGDAAEEREELA